LEIYRDAIWDCTINKAGHVSRGDSVLMYAGQRPDWDDVPQAAAAGTGAEGRGKGFSAADYAQLLGEDLA
jgi:hypothetical protein